MKHMLTKLVAIISTSFFASSLSYASNQDWPKEPVTTIVPWAVGGLADQVNRAMAQFGEEYVGQPILPTNRIGAGGVVALTEYLREKPNTTKIIYGSEGNFAISPLMNKVAYKWEDFEPVMNIYSSSFVLVANPNTKITDYNSLKAYGRNNKIIFGVNGLNSTEYMIMAALMTEMGINYEGVAFQGANEAMNATISGDTAFGITHASLAKEYVKAGKVTPLFIFDDKPLQDEVYDLQPISAYGHDTFIVNRMMMLTRAGTDPQVVEKIRRNFTAILSSPEFKKIAKQLGVYIDPVDGSALNQHVKSTIEKVNKYQTMLKK